MRIVRAHQALDFWFRAKPLVPNIYCHRAMNEWSGGGGWIRVFCTKRTWFLEAIRTCKSVIEQWPFHGAKTPTYSKDGRIYGFGDLVTSADLRSLSFQLRTIVESLTTQLQCFGSTYFATLRFAWLYALSIFINYFSSSDPHHDILTFPSFYLTYILTIFLAYLLIFFPAFCLAYLLQ